MNIYIYIYKYIYIYIYTYIYMIDFACRFFIPIEKNPHKLKKLRRRAWCSLNKLSLNPS